ncbi:ABC-2 family transporter protein [Clostridium saccharobutylicum]|uniref:lantibiotic immunity ABC transporter MutG family permease subunit n=1 Tax=Clostridium saccharobutylicum TaxID=169679 RepID=UPI000983D40A|nr:lantibiotic immunity ABC transporter MutG family permease subunit [Clostridium saccharobutylicum]AQS10278.1 ABC-2 family transporter protein [Clostridium saccharobutylicum]MBC2436544.1 lantibiotic immunity ABC transporter MutG family permease subunit [Clostridium saccharobutylicum]NSB87676.1 ABC-2 type transport system permease protein [Clostridium saccharobutylicum]NYC31212.1 ABC-2 type transport system permease protein [Clostridium saccharobutylicum]OOM17445.1 ABC-2 family transporter pro
MIYFFRVLHSDMLKMKKSMLKRIHFMIPLLGIIIFLSYCSFSPHSYIGEITGYLESIGVSFPLLISIVTSICIDQESAAGNFIDMLIGSKIKSMTFLSKMALLIIMGFLAIMVACIGFYFGFWYLRHGNTFNICFYIIAALILILSNIFEYIFHLFLSMRYGKSVSMGVGITETMLSALLITDLGYKIWPYIPCAWGTRFVNYWIISNSTSFLVNTDSKEIYYAIYSCVILTILAFIISCVWFYNWEGRRSES